ncbi:MAG: hypothetical protein AAFN93_23655, partial [Bacteroidota bacterium]
MNQLSKFLKCAYLILFIQTTHAQVPPERLSHALEVMYTFKVANDVNGKGLMVKRQEILDANGSLIGHMIEHLSFTGNRFTNGFNNTNTTQYLLTIDGGGIRGGKQLGSDCSNYEVRFEWNGDKITSISQYANRLRLVYNDEGKITKLESPSWSGTGKKKNWERNNYELTYDDQGRILEIRKVKEFGTGKVYNDVKLKRSQAEYMKKIIYDSPNVIVVEVMNYDVSNSEQEPRSISKTMITTQGDVRMIEQFKDGVKSGTREEKLLPNGIKEIKTAS